MRFCLCRVMSANRLSLAFRRVLSFFFQSMQAAIALRRAISVAVRFFCWIHSACSFRLTFLSLRSSCLTSLNNSNLHATLYALSFRFWISNSFRNDRCCSLYRLVLANFSPFFNLKCRKRDNFVHVWELCTWTYQQDLIGNSAIINSIITKRKKGKKKKETKEKPGIESYGIS